MEKYKFSEKDADELAKFLCPLMDFAPEKRLTAGQCLLHPWLKCKMEDTMDRQRRESETAKEALDKAQVAMSNMDIKGTQAGFSRTAMPIRASNQQTSIEASYFCVNVH